MCPAAPGVALIALKDKLVALSIQKNSIDVLRSCDFSFPEVWSIKQMSARPLEYVLGTKDGLRFVQFDHASNEFSAVIDSESKQALTLMSGRQTLQMHEFSPDVLLTADYNMPGYYTVNRATKEVRHITDAFSSNRGCFDIQVIPSFNIKTMPFAICKGRKGLALINL